jgi:hypothetical protein
MNAFATHPQQMKRAVADELDDAPGPKIPKSFLEKESSKRVIVVLDHASLETVKVSPLQAAVPEASLL